MHKIFIDGAAGTTALHIRSLLKAWEDANQISVIEIENTRDKTERKKAFAAADLSILCLPDDAAKEAVALLQGTSTRVIDASSAHRINPNWVYGMPELNSAQAGKIKNAEYVTNPGCFATGAVSILRPLIDAQVISADDTHSIIGLSGYSGGGKKLIEKHETSGEEFSLDNVVGSYSVNAKHKHVAEIKEYAQLNASPIFMPHVVNVPRGMMVSVAFNKASLKGGVSDVHDIYTNAYAFSGSKIDVLPLNANDKRMNFDLFTPLNQDSTKIIENVSLAVTGWNDGEDNQVTVHALLDNLGKGAAAQAVQNMRLMLQL